MTDLILIAAASIAAAVALAYGFVAINRMLAERRDAKLRRHLDWNGGGHRIPRVAAARRV